MTNDAIISYPDTVFFAKTMAEITVVPPNTDATLSFLGVSISTLTPDFNSNITNYKVCVAQNIRELVVTAKPTDPNATVSGDIGVPELTSDTTILTITVTAEDKITKKDYFITVIRNCDVSIKEVTSYDLHLQSYEVYDIMGRNVFTSPNPSKGGEHSPSFGGGWGEVLPQGIYIIRIKTDKGIIIKKIIIN